MENWKKVREDILHVLRGSVRTMHSSVVAQCEGTENPDTGLYPFELGSETGGRMRHMQGDKHGYWIAILQGYGEGKQAHSMRTQWTAYQVNKSVEPIFKELKEHKYRLHVTLIGKTNNILAEDERELRGTYYGFRSLCHEEHPVYGGNFDAYSLAPFLWGTLLGGSPAYCPAMPAQEFRINVPVNDLPDVARVTATIERIKEPQK
jgi:hypothetical protein